MRRSLPLLFIFVFLLYSCKSDDDAPLQPVDLLPAATQTGEQTLACLINGEVFIPSRLGLSRPRAFYQFVNGAFALGISGSRNIDNINIGATGIDSLIEGEYTLIEREDGNFFANAIIDSFFIFNEETTSNNPGKLVITNFDEDNFIISGTFEFTVTDNEGQTYEFTEGRFDLNYTN